MQRDFQEVLNPKINNITNLFKEQIMSVKSSKPGQVFNGRTARGLPASKGAMVIFKALALVASLPTAVAAYVGPGAGITAIGALCALIEAVFLTLGGLLAWPVRAFFRRRKKASQKAEESVPGTVDKTSGE